MKLAGVAQLCVVVCDGGKHFRVYCVDLQTEFVIATINTAPKKGSMVVYGCLLLDR